MDICRHYKNQVERRDRILLDQANARRYLNEPDVDSEMEAIELQMLEDNIQYAERIFTRINKKYGTAARNTVYRIYVEAEKADTVAAEQYVSRRTLLRNLHEWIESCL